MSDTELDMLPYYARAGTALLMLLLTRLEGAINLPGSIGKETAPIAEKNLKKVNMKVI
jgi:hypothetical protein